MNSVNKSVLRVNRFFKQLKKSTTNKIIIHTDQENALLQSNISDKRYNKISKIDGELFVVKANIRVKSFPYTGGIKEYESSISLTDDPLITKIKNSGGIIIGSTNMDEAAFGGDTSSSFYGRCINPINKNLSVGGSSGGSAAAISSGIVKYSIGTDTMGSVRIPASYCGVVGYRPSSLLCSNRDLILLSDTYDTIGFMSNKVNNINNIYVLIKCLNDKINEIKIKNKEIKCIVPTQVLEGEIKSNVLKDFKFMISKLKKNNINIVIKNLDFWSPNYHRKVLLKIVEHEGAQNLNELINNDKSQITDNLRKNLLYGKNIKSKDIKTFKCELKKLKNKIELLFEDYDLIITPTTPQNSFNISNNTPENQANFTCLANIADLPSLCLPFRSKNKQLSSLQLISSNMNDEFLIEISSVFEKILQ
ncbi:amidase [Alphaproteobacteria bacterium]|nr:amidase [Alphaproteobacteria bacterium]